MKTNFIFNEKPAWQIQLRLQKGIRRRVENMAQSKFILDVGKKIEQISGAEPTIVEKDTAPALDCFLFFFNSFIERCSNGKSANGTRDPCEALSLLNFVYI